MDRIGEGTSPANRRGGPVLFSLPALIEKYDMEISGIIHAGAHHGTEYSDYAACGVRRMIFFEPCDKAFRVLSRALGRKRGVRLVQSALGARRGRATMYVEAANQGMSNSLLRPRKHLEQYPQIEFGATETVAVERLDRFDCVGCNVLSMDVQGYELEILKGAPKTLRQIDYIYTEVNRAELYDGCARVGQLDRHLVDFRRVETSWMGGSWGDALYVRRTRLSGSHRQPKI
jgi:FkbM family methyltransferase